MYFSFLLCKSKKGTVPFLRLLVLSHKYTSLKVHHLQKISQAHILQPDVHQCGSCRPMIGSWVSKLGKGPVL